MMATTGKHKTAGSASPNARRALLSGAVLVGALWLPGLASAQVPSFYSAASGYGSACNTCHTTPPVVNATADTRVTSYPMTDVTTATVESLGAFQGFFNTFARLNGPPMSTLCGADLASLTNTNCTWPGSTATDVQSLRQYLMDVVDARVSIAGAAASLTGTSPVQSSTSATPNATVNFGRLAANATSGTVTVTVQNWRQTAQTLGVPTRSGGNVANFIIGARSCSSLTANAGNSCTFTVSFSAGATGGAKSTTLQIPFAAQVAGDTVPATRFITLSGSTNNIPVANAGIAQSVTAPTTVNLSGSSTDADGDARTYSWTLTQRPAGSSAALSGATTTTPSFVADKAGIYIASLVVNDGFNDSVASTVTITAANTAPVANAGTNQSVTAPVTVNLSGSGSDANGDTLTYSWTLPTKPTGSTAALSGATTTTPSFVADKGGTYVASLVVNDGTNNSVASTVTITAGNTAPVANAGPNQSVTAPVTVNLSGSGSDANGDTLTYSWALPVKPTGSAAALSGATTATPSFAADKAGTYVASLVVNDGTTTSVASTVTITAANTAPVANAGSNQSVLAGATVNLSGSASSDANGDTLTYSWTLPTKPAGSAATLGGATTATPSFVADLAGSYVASLTVSDGVTTSAPATVTLTATSAPGFVLTGTPVQPNVQVGTSGSTTLTITNTGNAALVLSTLTISGTNASEYTRGGTCANGTSLAGTLVPPRTSCTVIITFTPAASGTRSAVLTVAHNDGAVNAGNTTVALAGVGTTLLSPSLDLGTVTQLNFGSVLQGANASQSITVRNGNTAVGALSLNLNTLSVSGAAAGDYTLGGSCTATSSLASGASCTVSVSFAPQAAGARGATLNIASTNGGSATVPLTGTGVALADATLSGVPLAAFPSTLTNTTSPTSRTVTVNNPRANSITYGTAFGGTHAADFQVGSESCASRVVPAGGSCTVQVRFAPGTGAAGTRSATLVFAFIGFGTDPNPATLTTPVSGTAELPAPVFSISSSSLSFTAVVLSPTTGSAVLTNTGTANMSLSGLSFSGAQASDFLLDASNTCAAGLTLAPSSSCTLVLRYDPAAAGSSAASLALTTNAAGSPHTVTLSGTATPTPRPRIALSSLALAFGSLQVGTPSSQTVTVQNAGDATLNFSAFTLSGAASGDYSRAGTCATSASLAPLAQCDLTVTFNPTAAGSRNASLAVVSDAANGTAAISLSGTGVPVPAPVVTLAATAGLPLEYGSQTVGGLYPSRRVTLSNTGNADLVVSAVTVEGTGFSNASASACPSTLPAGFSCDIDVAFTPTAAATDYNGNVRVVSNAAGSPHTAALHGRGTAAAVPSVVWEPLVSRLDFGQVNAGSVSAVQSGTLKNNGPGGLRLTLLNAVGPDAAAFSVTAGSCQLGETLFEGQSCRIDIRFAPATAGSKAANVQVVSSGSFPTDLALAGVGMGGPNPGLALSARTLAFGAVRVGTQSLPAELTLAANGSGVVRVTGLAASDGWTVQPKSCPSLPFNLQAGSECTVTLVFTPRATGSATGQLTVTSDATNGASQQVALAGDGEAAPELSSGGCSISQGDAPGVDPTLVLLALLALAGLAHRRHLRRQARRDQP